MRMHKRVESKNPTQNEKKSIGGVNLNKDHPAYKIRPHELQLAIKVGDFAV